MARDELGIKICKALGLEPNDVYSISIDIAAGDVIEIHITLGRRVADKLNTVDWSNMWQGATVVIDAPSEE